MINRFGAETVYGRVLFYREMSRIIAAERIEQAYTSKKHAESPAKWVAENLPLFRLLDDAREAANG